MQKNNQNKVIKVIGAGLAGTEVSYLLANHGLQVELYDLKPETLSPAQHEKDLLAELVCSNSLKSMSKINASGLLKEEMVTLNSLFMEAALKARIEGSDDLVVDRNIFSSFITEKIKNHENITIISENFTLNDVNPDDIIILATGPLTSKEMLSTLKTMVGENFLNFYDAASPLIFASSIDKSNMIVGSKYSTGEEGNYLNIKLNKDQYFNFVEKLVSSEKVMTHEKSFFEGCLPIEVIASRGVNTLRFGPMSPKGIVPEDDKETFAVVQLRQDDVANSLYNLVGFQTNLTFKAQKELISSLPGLENVKFARFGLMHQNTYINAPVCLNRNLSLKKYPNIYVCGQFSGVEGYVESAATGLLCGYYVLNQLKGQDNNFVPLNTMLGSLVNYLVMSSPKHFSPINATYGILFAPNKKDKNALFENSIVSLKKWFEDSKFNEN